MSYKLKEIKISHIILHFPLFCTYLDFLQHLFVVAALDCTQKQSIVVGDLTFFFQGTRSCYDLRSSSNVRSYISSLHRDDIFAISEWAYISLSLFNFWTPLMVIIIGNGRIFLFPKFAFYLHCTIVYKDMEM